MALDRDARQELLQAAERDRQAEGFPFPYVDPEMWAHIFREHRPPPLTKIEQRRAAAITFDESPRAVLAAAWAGASDRDRRDLVNRATGKCGQTARSGHAGNASEKASGRTCACGTVCPARMTRKTSGASFAGSGKRCAIKGLLH